MKATKIFFILLIACTGITAAGQTYELMNTGSTTVVKGTSSLHDWKMDLEKMKSGFRLVSDGKTIRNIDNVTFTCFAKDLKSESSLMDRKAYEALKADKFPEIKFISNSVSGLTSEGGKISGTLKGNLDVAGESHEISVPFTGIINEDQTVSIVATTDMTFSSFKMSPPTAMLGTLKTGDKVTISINLKYLQKSR